MPCLKDILCGKRTIIGIRNFVECQNPESNLFINDFPGMELKSAAKLTPDEIGTGNELFKKSIEQAIKLTYDDLMDFLNSRFNFNAIIETREFNDFSDTVTPAANLERGLILKRWRSEMAKIHIEEIYIKTAQSSVVDILVYDGFDVYKIENVTLEAGIINRVPINIVCKSETVKVLYNQSNNDTYGCNYNQNDGWVSCGTCHSRGGKFFAVHGWDSTKEVSNCFGMGILARVRCFEEEIFCALLPRLYIPIWYRSVIEFLKYRINTTRVNNLTIFGEEKAKEMLVEYQDKYEEKYEKVIKNADVFLKTLKNDCLTCNGMRYVQQTP